MEGLRASLTPPPLPEAGRPRKGSGRRTDRLAPFESMRGRAAGAFLGTLTMLSPTRAQPTQRSCEPRSPASVPGSRRPRHAACGCTKFRRSQRSTSRASPGNGAAGIGLARLPPEITRLDASAEPRPSPRTRTNRPHRPSSSLRSRHVALHGLLLDGALRRPRGDGDTGHPRRGEVAVDPTKQLAVITEVQALLATARREAAAGRDATSRPSSSADRGAARRARDGARRDSTRPNRTHHRPNRSRPPTAAITRPANRDHSPRQLATRPRQPRRRHRPTPTPPPRKRCAPPCKTCKPPASPDGHPDRRPLGPDQPARRHRPPAADPRPSRTSPRPSRTSPRPSRTSPPTKRDIATDQAALRPTKPHVTTDQAARRHRPTTTSPPTKRDRAPTERRSGS